MQKFVIITDSCSDLDRARREKYDIDYIPMHMTCDGVDYIADLDWQKLSVTQFYNMMREGKRFFTAQIPAYEYAERFTEYLEQGYDILNISISSALSASYETSVKVADELMQKYPERTIKCIDSRRACLGLGVLCIMASKLRAEGKTVSEVAAWLEENKQKSNQECTVDSLKYFRQAGRVSAATAFFGGLMAVKPIVISDALGHNAAIEKVKGKKSAMERLIERCVDEIDPSIHDTVYVSHADSLAEGENIKAILIDKLGDKVKVELGIIGPIIGATAGPGTLAIHFMGKEVTVELK